MQPAIPPSRESLYQIFNPPRAPTAADDSVVTSPSPQQPSRRQSNGLPHDHQSPQLSPQLSQTTKQLSRQSSGSDSPHNQSPSLSFKMSPPPNPPPSLVQLPQQDRYQYTSADVLKVMTRDNFNILLFRITLYLGYIFDGQVDRKRYAGQSLATYHNQRHGVTLRITDTFGPEIKEKHESSFPDIILMCLPLNSDADIRRRENHTLQVMKRSYKNYVWDRVVIVLTVPNSEKNETAVSRQNDIKRYMRSLGIPTIPPFICTSETLIKDMSSDPKPKWYTELWSAIFKHCSDAGCPTLHVHLTDRLTDTSATKRSCLPKIPKEAIEILEKRIKKQQKAKDMTRQLSSKQATHQTRHKKPIWRN